MMLMKNYGFSEEEVQEFRDILKTGYGGHPDMFKGFAKFDIIDDVRLAYAQNYIQEFADFYNQKILPYPERQVILLDDQTTALNYLKKLISSDILVMVDIHYGTHFVIATGYDENYIYLNDPGFDGGEYKYGEEGYQEKTKMSVERFLQEWNISQQEKLLQEMPGAIGFPGDYGMVWLEK
jgi:hypothetical protein